MARGTRGKGMHMQIYRVRRLVHGEPSQEQINAMFASREAAEVFTKSYYNQVTGWTYEIDVLPVYDVESAKAVWS